MQTQGHVKGPELRCKALEESASYTFYSSVLVPYYFRTWTESKLCVVRGVSRGAAVILGEVPGGALQAFPGLK